MKLIKTIDRLLDRMTMYRLTLYYLTAIWLAGLGLSFSGVAPFGPAALIYSTAVLTAVCWLSNRLLAKLFQAPAGSDSLYITALILALIVTPPASLVGSWPLAVIAILAMASKYILTIRRQHIFNPAAVAVVLGGFLGGQFAPSWWVGNKWLLPVVLAGGVLLARKIQRGQMITWFVASSLVATAVYAWIGGRNPGPQLMQMLLSSALFFMAFVMLSEPLTSPTTHRWQRWYALMVGWLFPPPVHILGLYSTPQLALVAGNLFAYFSGPPKSRLLLRLIARNRLSPSCYEFVFEADAPLNFRPGQYIEWTLPHHGTDRRGNRRFFTLASSPTEKHIRLGVKFYSNGSSFKTALLESGSGTRLAAAGLGGDFVLPPDRRSRLVFIAGGIGITPYRSMLKYLLDKNEPRPITLIYSARSADELLYREILEAAADRLDVKLVYTLTGRAAAPKDWTGRRGQIDAEMIRSAVADYHQSLFYISGPQPMVAAVRQSLKVLGIPANHIKQDYFSGYA